MTSSGDDKALAALAGLAGLATLAVLLQKPEVKDVWYNAKKITLDGYKFSGCRFDNCELHLSSANFEMESCFIDQNTTIFYNGEIVKILKLFNGRYEWAYQTLPGFVPVRNIDGTITIK